MIALLTQGVFSPNFLLNRAGPLLICFVAIVTNWPAIYENLYYGQETEVEQQEDF